MLISDDGHCRYLAPYQCPKCKVLHGDELIKAMAEHEGKTVEEIQAILDEFKRAHPNLFTEV